MILICWLPRLKPSFPHWIKMLQGVVENKTRMKLLCAIGAPVYEGPSPVHSVCRWAARKAGHPLTFFSAVTIIVLWAVAGPFFGWSDTWQLVINTGTTIITFLMVFLIQHTQNTDTEAVHLKLDELIRSLGKARNSLVSLEDLSDDQLIN